MRIPKDWDEYQDEILRIEKSEGFSTSDAQGVVDAAMLKNGLDPMMFDRPQRTIKKSGELSIKSREGWTKTQFFDALEQIQNSGAAFWDRTEGNKVVIWVRAAYVNDPNQWENVHRIENAFGGLVREAEPDPQSGNIRVVVKVPKE